jgi:signal transduction histidine kinase
MVLPAVDEDRSLQLPAPERRWLPMRRDRVLLGALRIETAELPWPESLMARLQSVAHCLTEAISLDMEQQRLAHQLERQQQQLRLLVHQLRNPLAALRTFGKLLRRRLEGDPETRGLVDSLLAEEQQLNRYVDAIDGLSDRPVIGPGTADPQPLLLPPSLNSAEVQPLQERLEPLLQRAEATATLQGRQWQGPERMSQWNGNSAAVAEILANLLENAFRYSPDGAPVGFACQEPEPGEHGLRLIVWDGGPAIATEEREAIFQRGVRGEQARGKSGSGLGLALARELARNLGGELTLSTSPQAIDASLPAEGNAFCLQLPGSA